jgi:glycosyltransferase involved in cell wall biosynthesis
LLDAWPLHGITKVAGAPKMGSWRGIVSLVRETARRAREVDVIYANTQRAMIIGVLAGAIARRPVVWHLRDIVSPEHFGRWQRAAIRWCGKLGLDHVIANSDASAKAFTELAGVPEGRVDVVFNGISEAPFRRYDNVQRVVLRERLGLTRDAFIVGSFSRLAQWKGQHVLLQAALLDPQMHVALVGAALFGEHDYEASLKAFVQAHDMTSRVHFLGFREDVPACMRAVDVVAHTSIAPEPFGRVVVEGMLAKRPVVAMRSGGVTEVVDHATTGLLCEPDSAPALAEALMRLRTDAALCERLVENGYAVARRKFGDKPYADRVRRILGQTAACRVR